MEGVYIAIIVIMTVVVLAGTTTLIVLAYLKWKEYKQLRGELLDSSRRHAGSRTRRRTRQIRVRNAVTPHTTSDSGPLHPPPYSSMDMEHPPPSYSSSLVLSPARANSIFERPGTSSGMHPRPSTSSEHFGGFQRYPQNTGSTNTPMETPASEMFATRPSTSQTPQPVPNLPENTLEQQQHQQFVESNNRNNTGTTNTPIGVINSDKELTTVIVEPRNKSLSSKKKSKDDLQIENI